MSRVSPEIVEGIVPVKAQLRIEKYFRFDHESTKSSIGPDKPGLRFKRSVSKSKFLKVLGTVPVKLLLESSNLVSFDSDPNSVAIVEPKRLASRTRDSVVKGSETFNEVVPHL